MNKYINEVIQQLEGDINETFIRLERWFLKNENLRGFLSEKEKWNINQVLEHVSLVNHYLLILIVKGRKKALNNTQNRNLKEELEGYTLSCERLDMIGINNSFPWENPDHMTPTGAKPLDEIKENLIKQKNTCLEIKGSF